jgi:hypothetical protein
VSWLDFGSGAVAMPYEPEGSHRLLDIPVISTRCENLGKHVSGTVVLGYTLSDLVVRRPPALMNIWRPRLFRVRE